MDYTTSDVNTPGAIIQLLELISMNISVTVPEVGLSIHVLILQEKNMS